MSQIISKRLYLDEPSGMITPRTTFYKEMEWAGLSEGKGKTSFEYLLVGHPSVIA